MPKVLSLRPLKDFYDLGVYPSEKLFVSDLDPLHPSLREKISSVDAVILPAVGIKIDSSLFEASEVKLIQITGAGFDRLNVIELRALGIPVANIPGGSASAVSEYVLTVTLFLLSNLSYSTSSILQGKYSSLRHELISKGINQLSGLTIGIVGYGIIGKAVKRAFEFFEAKVNFYDPWVEGSLELPDILSGSDVVSIHVPLNDKTRNLIGINELKSMKPGSLLINASRGGVVDEDSLVKMLNEEHLGGAAIDVFSQEPLTSQSPFLKLSEKVAQRVILTPHIAGISRQAWTKLFKDSWQNVERVLLNDEPPKFVVNKD